MANLQDEIIQHWQSFKNPLINDILINLEKLEKELPSLQDAEMKEVERLVNSCKDIKVDQVDEMEFIRVLNAMPAAFMLFIIHRLQTLNSDLIMKIISFAQKKKETDEEVRRFFQRNMVFEKSQLLGRIFSTNRMETVLSIL